jgi:hypothetical protein
MDDDEDARKDGELETITVFGAGLEAVNGEYHFAGRDEHNFPMYEMHGMLKGKAVTCRIESDPYWWIFMDDEIFFSANRDSDSSNFCPPHRVWFSLEDTKASCDEIESGSFKAYSPPFILHGQKDTSLDWRRPGGKLYRLYHQDFIQEGEMQCTLHRDLSSPTDRFGKL